MHNNDNIVATFNEINEGRLSHASFSNANVVMITKDSYYALSDAAEIIQFIINKYNLNEKKN